MSESGIRNEAKRGSVSETKVKKEPVEKLTSLNFDLEAITDAEAGRSAAKSLWKVVRKF